MSRKSQVKARASLRADGPAKGTAEFDKELIVDSFKAPTPAARAQWRRAKRKRGRPRKGRGVKVISVSLERSLLDQCDALARRMGVSRASLISSGVRRMLSATSPV